MHFDFVVGSGGVGGAGNDGFGGGGDDGGGYGGVDELRSRLIP